MNLGVSPARTVLSEHAMHSTQSAGMRSHSQTTPALLHVPGGSNLVQETMVTLGDSPGGVFS